MKTSLKEMGHKDCILLCHDWGSVIGIQLQRRYPKYIRKFIILDVLLNTESVLFNFKEGFTMLN